MADQAPITPAAPAATFNHAAWLSQFEAIGGGFLATESQTSLCIACQGNTPENQSAAHAMLRDLTDNQRAAVVEHIRERAGLSARQSVLNAISLEKLSDPAGTSETPSGPTLGLSKGSQSMDMTHAFTATAPVYFPAVSQSGQGREFQSAAKAWINAVSAIESHPGHQDIPRDLCDAQSVAWQAMLDAPAPDLASLRFKLEQLLQVSDASPVQPAVVSIIKTEKTRCLIITSPC